MNIAHALTHTETASQVSTNKIRELNDFFRRNLFAVGKYCDVILTAGVSALSNSARFSLLDEVRCFEDFNEDNDPHGEHDFGRIDFKGESHLFKIDDYAGHRVLTIMRADEY